MSESNGMTRAERAELIGLAKKRERVAKTLAVHRTAQLKARKIGATARHSHVWEHTGAPYVVVSAKEGAR